MRGVFGKNKAILAPLLMVTLLAFSSRATFAESSTTEFNLEVLPMLSLSLSGNNVNLHMLPYTDDAFSHDTIDLVVNTNNRTGYKLIMSLTSDENALVQSGVSTKIANLEQNVSVTDSDKSNFTINSWGYTTTNRIGLGSTTTFSPVPEFGDPETINLSDSAINNAETSVTFAAYSDANISSGKYMNTVMFTAISNYVSVIDDFFHISYLQEMTPAICETATIPYEYSLNLDYDGSHAGDPEYVPTVTLFDNRDNASYTVSRMPDGNCWMTENLRLASSAERKLTSSNSDLPEGSPEFILPAAQKSTGVQWAYSYSDIANTDSNHAYHVASKSGNLYNWYAATAGTGTYLTSSSDATGSICPRGWQLPSATGDKSYAHYLNDVLGYANNEAGSATVLRVAPFSGINTGFYHYSGQIQEPNTFTVITKTPINNTSVYAMNVAETSTDTMSTAYKVNGYSVRCVAK